MEFSVHWIGYDEPTWEPWKNVRNSRDKFDLWVRKSSNEIYRGWLEIIDAGSSTGEAKVETIANTIYSSDDDAVIQTISVD
jgi:hypothetical protein